MRQLNNMPVVRHQQRQLLTPGNHAFGRAASLAACCFVLALVSGPAVAGDDVPAWLRQAAGVRAPAFDNKVVAVVLFKEQAVKVNDNGKVMTVERGAIRILSSKGREKARAAVTYLTDSGKVHEMRAWLIRQSGEVIKIGGRDILDLAADSKDIYNEVRVKLIEASGEAEPGAVFGYEWEAEDRSIFTQFDWQFQDRLPTLASRYTITLPTGWRAEGVMFNHPKIEPVITGSTYCWELRDLPFIDEEPASPPVTNLAPRLAVSYFPPPGTKAGGGKTFDSWSDVSRWMSELSDPQASVDNALAGKARELVASAGTELERIRAIGGYVQGLNYVSIQTGVGRGGGYRPHPATEVFAKRYGDCKDKANLMRAMLKAVNIPAYLVSIYAGDPTYVREEWPSPQQFNHCIIAIKVSDETQAATIINHPTLGRLLVFDPTDGSTPVGDLPDHEQGGLALIIAGDQGTLLRMPVTPPEASKMERQADVVLDSDGSITANLRERSMGQAAVAERRSFKALERLDYIKMVEKWVTGGATGASISKVEASDNNIEGKFALDVNFTAARYGQLMQGRLLVFKPAIVPRLESLALTESSRKYPVVLQPQSYAETVRIKLPREFGVDELPEPSKLDTSFGSYATTYEVKDGQLHFTRSMVLKRVTVPVTEYEKVRGFFERIRAAEQAPVVLSKSN